MYKQLTTAEKAKLYRLFLTGKYTLKELVGIFGISPPAVSYQLTKRLKR